jgi:hypothetical protein
MQNYDKDTGCMFGVLTLYKSLAKVSSQRPLFFIKNLRKADEACKGEPVGWAKRILPNRKLSVK